MRFTGGEIDDVLAFENELMIERFARDWCVSIERANRLFLELKKFLLIMAKIQKEAPAERHSPPRELDALWHHFMVYDSELYQNFCQQFLGRIIHHRMTERPFKRGRMERVAVQLGLALDGEIWDYTLGGGSDADCG